MKYFLLTLINIFFFNSMSFGYVCNGTTNNYHAQILHVPNETQGFLNLENLNYLSNELPQYSNYELECSNINIPTKILIRCGYNHSPDFKNEFIMKTEMLQGAGSPLNAMLEIYPDNMGIYEIISMECSP